MDDNTETNNPPPIPASSDTKNDFSYKEGTILKIVSLMETFMFPPVCAMALAESETAEAIEASPMGNIW